MKSGFTTSSYGGSVNLVAATVASKHFFVPASAGVHKLDIYWLTGAGTATASRRHFMAKEA